MQLEVGQTLPQTRAQVGVWDPWCPIRLLWPLLSHLSIHLHPTTARDFSQVGPSLIPLPFRHLHGRLYKWQQPEFTRQNAWSTDLGQRPELKEGLRTSLS